MGETELVTLSECASIGVHGTLGLQAAAAYWGMATYDFTHLPIFIFESDEMIECHGNISYIGVARKLDNGHLIDISSQYGEGITVTDKVQTICDMIICNCDIFHTLETIDDYYTYESEDDVNKLESLAREYGVYERLQELVEESQCIYDE